MNNLTDEEQIIKQAIVDARKVQDFIWGNQSLLTDDGLDIDTWVKVFQKRVDKIANLNPKHPSAVIELRKRVLQQAALSIMALLLLNKTATIIYYDKTENNA